MKDPIETIIETLAPVLGEHMSRTAVIGSLEKMGTSRERATSADLERLIRRLGLGLNVFVGRQVSKTLVEDLCDTLGLARTDKPT